MYHFYLILSLFQQILDKTDGWVTDIEDWFDDRIKPYDKYRLVLESVFHIWKKIFIHHFYPRFVSFWLINCNKTMSVTKFVISMGNG